MFNGKDITMNICIQIRTKAIFKHALVLIFSARLNDKDFCKILKKGIDN